MRLHIPGGDEGVTQRDKGYAMQTPEGMCSESYPRQEVRGEIEKITLKPKSIPKGVKATAF